MTTTINTNNTIIDTIRNTLENRKTRSAWDRGVNVYAMHLLDNLEESITNGYFDADDLASRKMTERELLNGADDWKQYSWGGCAYIYDGDIAEVLCNPSELKKTDHGNRKPNAREEWLDVQARALYQASNLLLDMIADAVNA